MSTPVLAPNPTPLLAQSKAGAVALAIIAPIGPLLMAGWSFSSPSNPGDDIPTSIVKLAANPGASQLMLGFILLAAVFGSAGSLVVGAAIRRGAPKLGAVATALAFVGFIIAGYPGPIAAVAASTGAGLSDSQVASLVSAIDSQLQGAIAQVLFVTLPAGILLLGIAAMMAAVRRRAYPLGAAILLAAAIPIVLICGFFSSLALGVAWVAVAVAYGIGGWVYARAARG